MSNVLWGFPNPQAILVDEAGQGGGGVIYKSYTARLTQVGTANPVAVVLEDSTGLGNTWGRVVAGVYTCTFSIPIDDNKIWWPVIGVYDGNATGYIPIIDGSAVIGYYTWYFNGPPGARTSIQIDFVDPINFLSVEWSSLLDGGGGNNSVINFEYRLYP